MDVPFIDDMRSYANKEPNSRVIITK